MKVEGGGAGFTLVEVLVALVVLEVGLLGVVGMSVLAAGTMARAAERQRAVGSLEVVADSLLRHGVAGAGEREMGAHRIRWSTRGGVTTVLAVRVREDGSDGDVLLEVGMARP